LLNKRSKVKRLIRRLASESPFRLPARYLVATLPFSIRTKARFDAFERPGYLFGVLEAADEARRQGVDQISVLEFGVAAGNGLVALQAASEAVEEETGVHITVFGFDLGNGLPRLIGDYRDHPDEWRSGDFPMDEDALRRRLTSRTKLLLGDVSETVDDFLAQTERAPIGFVSFDLDLYSSTKQALEVLRSPRRRMLRRVFLYFDDVQLPMTHDFAGELLAIREFNDETEDVKIDRLRTVRYERPFHESWWLGNVYCAHDLAAISTFSLVRGSDDGTFRL
jgi:hypothetical protein